MTTTTTTTTTNEPVIIRRTSAGWVAVDPYGAIRTDAYPTAEAAETAARGRGYQVFRERQPAAA